MEGRKVVPCRITAAPFFWLSVAGMLSGQASFFHVEPTGDRISRSIILKSMLVYTSMIVQSMFVC